MVLNGQEIGKIILKLVMHSDFNLFSRNTLHSEEKDCIKQTKNIRKHN